MTNYEHWMHYLDKVQPPPLFAKVGFYYMISTALQRRVWIGDEETRVFPNLYVVFTATAGGGKGLVTGPMDSLLKYHLVPDPAGSVKAQLKAVGVETPPELFPAKKDGSTRPEYLFPCAPDSTTKESLGREMAQSVRTHVVMGSDGNVADVYQHNSLHFNLDELQSLLNDESQKTMIFLLSMYMCKEGVRHETIGRGSDYIAKGCLSLIGSITPTDLIKLLKRDVLKNGFVSRAWFVYDTPKPVDDWLFDDRSPAEKQSKQVLLNWLFKLSQVYGKVTVPPDVRGFIRDYIRKVSSGDRTNKDPNLDTYYQRYQLHLQKAIMSVHFARTTDMILTMEDAYGAIELLEAIETPMHKCFLETGRNEVAGVADQLWIRMLKMPDRAMTERQVKAFVFKDIRNKFEFDSMIEGLINQGKLIAGSNPVSGEKMYQAQIV